MSRASQELSIFVFKPFCFLFTFVHWRRQLEVRANLGTSAERWQLHGESLQLFRCRYEGLISLGVGKTTEGHLDYIVDETGQIRHFGNVLLWLKILAPFPIHFPMITFEWLRFC